MRSSTVRLVGRRAARALAVCLAAWASTALAPAIARAQGVDTCDMAATAPTVAEGSFAFDTSAALPALPDFATDANCYTGRHLVRDVWFKYVPTQSGIAIINLCGTTFASNVVSVFTDCELAAQACGQPTSDRGCAGIASSTTLHVIAGSVYFVRVAGFTSSPNTVNESDAAAKGAGVLNIRVGQFPINEVCDTAAAIGVGATVADNELATSDEPSRSNCAYSAPGGPPHISEHDLWYVYTPAFTGHAVAFVTGYPDTGSYRNVVLSAYPSCVPDAAPLAETSPDNASQTGKAIFPVQTGVPVYLRVAGSGLTSPFWGRFTINLDQAPTPPSNNTCQSPLPLAVGNTPYTLLNASTDCYQSSAICRTPNPDVWFTFTPASAGAAVITLSDPGSQWTMNLLNTCPFPAPADSIFNATNGVIASASEAVCLSQVSTTGTGVLRACVEPGVQYYLRVSGSNATGAINFSLQAPSAHAAPSSGDAEVDAPCPATLNVFPTCATVPTLQSMTSGVPVLGTFAPFDSDWFKFTVPGTGGKTVTIDGQSQFSITTELYQITNTTNCAMTRVQATGSVAGCSDSFSMQVPGLQGGATYFVRITQGPGASIQNCTNNAYWVRAAVTCAADFNNDGVRTVADLFVFLSAWFARDPRADIDGIGGTNVTDIFAFLSLWFAGC